MIDPRDCYNTPSEIESILGTVDTYIRWREKNGKERKYNIYHPSAFGQCLRRMQYQRYESEGAIQSDGVDFESRMLRLFEKGHNMQSRWEKYFTEMGILRGIWTCSNPKCQNWDDDGKYIEGELELKKHPRKYGEDKKIGCFKPDKCICGSKRFDYNEVSVSAPELNMVGHADIILDYSKFDPEKYNSLIRSFNMEDIPKNPIVIDMKTINSNGFDNLVKYKKPPGLGYQVQLTIYIHLLECEYGVLIYENKNDSTLKAYKIPRDEESWELIQSQAKLMDKMAKMEDNGKKLFLLPPPRPTSKTCWECKGCGYKKICHKSSIWKNDTLDKKRKNFYGHLI